jgi:hypothetical protein
MKDRIMKRVIIESPYAGDIARNKAYLQACIRDCLNRGEAPFASHQMYTDALDDNDPEQRKLGMLAGLRWAWCADAIVVYGDHGISPGMKWAIEQTVKHMPVEYRLLYDLQTPDATSTFETGARPCL